MTNEALKLTIQAKALAGVADDLVAIGSDNITVKDLRDKAEYFGQKSLGETNAKRAAKMKAPSEALELTLQAKALTDMACAWSAMGADNITVNDLRERAGRFRQKSREFSEKAKHRAADQSEV